MAAKLSLYVSVTCVLRCCSLAVAAYAVNATANDDRAVQPVVVVELPQVLRNL